MLIVCALRLQINFLQKNELRKSILETSVYEQQL